MATSKTTTTTATTTPATPTDAGANSAAPLAEPQAGGRYVRDPATGALVRETEPATVTQDTKE